MVKVLPSPLYHCVFVCEAKVHMEKSREGGRAASPMGFHL